MNKTNEMKGIPAIMSEHRNAESVVEILRRIEAKIDALATSAPATKTKDKAPPKYNSRDSILAAITAYMKPDGRIVSEAEQQRRDKVGE